jgi:hypothetical protein
MESCTGLEHTSWLALGVMCVLPLLCPILPALLTRATHMSLLFSYLVCLLSLCHQP